MKMEKLGNAKHQVAHFQKILLIRGDVSMNFKNTSHYIFENCDTVELAKTFGTPLYVISEDRIRNKCTDVRDNFLRKYPNTKAAYASKAFLTMAMCKIIEAEGLGLDVVSGGELYTAIKADFPMEKVIFHGNNKSYEELILAVTNNVGRIIVDNLYELEMLNHIAKDQGKKVKILFRITPGVGGKTHQYITTGQTDSKFGIPLEKDVIENTVKKAIDSSNLDLKGFHFHVGSQLFEVDSQLIAIKTVLSLIKDLKENLGFLVEELNTGGGFGIHYNEDDEETKPISFFIDPIMETVKEGCKEFGLDMPTVIIEPGRWIVGEAGMTLYTLGAIKEISNVRTYISVDGGLPDNPRPALYKAKYDAIVANKANEKPEEVVTIAGKCCESGDILIWDLKVPKIESGDILAVFATGAYNYSMASNYNKLPRPAVVLVSEGKAELMVERESYEDLLNKEIIPHHLDNIRSTKLTFGA